MTTIRIKRVYEPVEKKDGFRILVDRLWPRGIKKESLHAETWIKEAAPSAALRKWFNHEPEKWAAFRDKYKNELKKNTAITELLQYVGKHTTLTLLYAAKDEAHNQAVILQQFLEERLKDK
ncbi:MAG: DUF488 domain-containing protein [Bacteroidota bacterium]